VCTSLWILSGRQLEADLDHIWPKGTYTTSEGPDKGTRGASSVKNAVLHLRVLYFNRPTCRIYKNGKICRFENFPTILGTGTPKFKFLFCKYSLKNKNKNFADLYKPS